MFYRRAVLSLTLDLLAVCLLSLPLSLLLHAAPAPLPKRAKEKPPALPAECVMHWHGAPYRACFRPGGSYEARDPWCHWQGTWFIEGNVLYVRESTRPHDPDSFSEYKIWLTPCLRHGSIGCESGGGEFRLE